MESAAQIGVRLKIPGSDAQGVTDAMSFLRTYRLKGSVEVCQKVVVIGGGNAAIDAARTAVRLGAKNVTIVYRRTQADMPAFMEEISESLLEGVKIKELTNPEEIITENGKVKAVKCHAMKLGGFDSTGRRKPVKNGQSLVVRCRHGDIRVRSDA